jgi:hypothetical protein
MKNNAVRPISFIITAMGIILVIIAVVYAEHHPMPFIPTPPPITPTPASTQDAYSSVCYILNKPTADGGRDFAYLKVSSSDGIHITGEFGTALDGKDKIDGTLIGTASANSATQTVLFDGQYSNTGEGMNNVVEQMIKLNENQAQIGYGDMKANANGTYSYIDPSKVTYSLTLPSVDCTQYDALVTATETK